MAATGKGREGGLDRLAVGCFLLWSVGAGLTPVVGIWAGIGGAAIGLGIGALAFARGVVAPLLRPSWRVLVWGMGATVVMVAVTYGLWPLLRQAFAGLGAGVGTLYDTFRAPEPLWVTRALLPFIIVAEELVWRGVVLEALSRRMAAAAAVFASSAVYAAAHAPAGSVLLTALALVCGLFWSGLRVRTGSLLPGLVSHLVWDTLLFVIWPLA